MMMIHSQSINDRKEFIGKRMRGIFMLRTMNTLPAAMELANSLLVTKGDSVLLRHEIGFVLGQMGYKETVPMLTAILEDTTENEIVRHEAGEALGAIADPSSLPILKKYCNDERPEVRETCMIAVERVEWILNNGKDKKENDSDENIFNTVDPAPPLENVKSTSELGDILCDQSRPLYERYRAMFSLRNKSTDADIIALTKGLEDPSALFRHEVAYVLGQLAHPLAFKALQKTLSDLNEHPMVRHEAAEAIGAIGDEVSQSVLHEYAKDDAKIVKESCEVALDVVEYWAEFEGSAKVDN